MPAATQAFQATMDVINAFSQGKTPEVVLDKTFPADHLG